ncbi:MAG: DUF6089 family protein [Prevotella sp.]
MNRLLAIILFVACSAGVRAQTDDLYRMEIGAGIGMVSYEGDFNGSIFKNSQPAASFVLRRIFNPFIGLRLAATYGKLKGSSDDVETYYPDHQEQTYDFNRTLVDASLTFEYNFWPYGTGRDYRGAKRLTPFIFGGIGATSVSGEGKSVFTANIPLGLGVKYKIGPRLNLGVEWAMHFSLSDELDGVKDPYGVKSSGAFKNTDCYSALQVTLTYSFMAKCRTCHNADE